MSALTWDALGWRCYSARGGWWVEMWAQGTGASVISGWHRDLWDALSEAAARLGVSSG